MTTESIGRLKNSVCIYQNVIYELAYFKMH